MLKEFMAKANFEQIRPHQKCLVRSRLLNPKRDQNRLLLPKDGQVNVNSLPLIKQRIALQDSPIEISVRLNEIPRFSFFSNRHKACFYQTVAYLFMHVHAINAPDIVICNILCENFSMILKHHLLLALQSWQ